MSLYQQPEEGMTDVQYFAAAYLITLRFPLQFRKDFIDWLHDNLAIQRAFDAEALRVIAIGRSHYSAHTIIEYLRHYTMLHSADARGELKIDERWTSSMTRLFAHMHPTHSGFLSMRQRAGGVVAAFSLV
jgi:hypothetical protein